MPPVHSLSFVQDYNLTEEIEQADEFTVFAPTNAAVNDYLQKMAATALVERRSFCLSAISYCSCSPLSLSNVYFRRSIFLNVLLFCCRKQDVNTTRYHVVASERLLKTDLQPGGYKETLLGFSFQLSFVPRDGKVWIRHVDHQ